MKIGISVGGPMIFSWLFKRIIHEDVKVTRFTFFDADTFDLVLFTGGADVSPELYGEKNYGLSHTNLLRDDFEMKILKVVQHLGIPQMGICRGHQFLNAAYGGKLIQNLEIPHRWCHNIFFPNMKNETEQIAVNSTHHQAVRKSPFEVLATAADGTVELAAAENILTMQFHPESFMTLDIQDKLRLLVKNLLKM